MTDGDTSKFFYDEKGNLLREERTKNGVTYKVNYIYAGGEAIGFTLRGQWKIDLDGAKAQDFPFYYVKDAQGNVRKIVDRMGNCVVKYNYNAWGKETVTPVESTWEFPLEFNSDGTVKKFCRASDIAELNRLTYRCYFYNRELGLYYLINRYYDPETGRFMLPTDMSYPAGSEVWRVTNLHYDKYLQSGDIYQPSLNWFDELMITGVIASGKTFLGLLSQVATSICFYLVDVVCAVGDLIFNNGQGAWADMNRIHWNPFNDDESLVLESKYVSFYKGVAVFRFDSKGIFAGTNGRSGTFGAIFLNRQANFQNNPEDIVRHEWGHVPQAVIMGYPNFIFTVAPMSSLEMGKGKWGKSYYDSPWELTADAFGGVQSRFRTNKEVEYGWRYLLECALFAPLAYLFLL